MNWCDVGGLVRDHQSFGQSLVVAGQAAEAGIRANARFTTQRRGSRTKPRLVAGATALSSLPDRGVPVPHVADVDMRDGAVTLSPTA